jgi:hypothetical protein
MNSYSSEFDGGDGVGSIGINILFTGLSGLDCGHADGAGDGKGCGYNEKCDYSDGYGYNEGHGAGICSLYLENNFNGGVEMEKWRVRDNGLGKYKDKI